MLHGPQKRAEVRSLQPVGSGFRAACRFMPRIRESDDGHAWNASYGNLSASVPPSDDATANSLLWSLDADDANVAAMHGAAAATRAVRNVLYAEACRRAFAECRAITLGWDGSCHGGPEVLCGFAINVTTKLAAYLRPQVEGA